MELLSVGLWGYKRFEGDHGNLDVVGSPIAIVGPNEVGKTSFLKALLHLDHDEGFDLGEFTRQGDGKLCVRALYALDDDDYAAIESVGGVGRPITFTIYKREDALRYTKLEPPLRRDRQPREKAVELIRRLFKSRWMKKGVEDSLVEQVTRLHDELDSVEEGIENELLELIRETANAIKKRPDVPELVKRLAHHLDVVAETEAIDEPDLAARRVLLRKRPRFLWFPEERRQIETPYNVTQTPSEALLNLLGLIDFDLVALRGATAQGDRTTVAEMIDAANRAYENVFTGRWRQANVQVFLDMQGDLMYIYVTRATRRLVPLAEHSEGLRHFIALLAFVEREAATGDAIILVDEAEQHLHYDAQADLVRVFSEQTAAKKIIYTTHSAGCLPHDLGTGVRVLEPTGPTDVDPSDWDRSQIRNWFWTKGPGFSPLLMAMGASTFAFAGARMAVVAEGISDVLLLPTLFREATGKETIKFQVAPGLANVGAETLGELDFVASRVVYLVDGDEAGLLKREQLLEAGIPDARIFILGKRSKLTLEDVLRKDLYLAAVNRELELRHNIQLPAGVVPKVGRKKAIEDWCDRQVDATGRQVERPSERSVAHHLFVAQREARQRGEHAQLLDPSRQKLLAKLHDEIHDVLSRPLQGAENS